ncbi:mechanosensitive ion channel family protein [Polyangium jinanense]|uniref:Mechanosensitive ion channel family protein n=1 Tax=Polyangium jinanense TaxID=2829994 RepID=A0A9X3X9Z1_9BACT|nr:mechanosensitive ion channel family protein [Polyangium jinanense]MDC3962284.1 mechanosensitive ion channel family protein [Polyangium jinanense]MDC3985465.1 mechanosensitive ion channel family protein [Polyangium jinanense]
MNETIQKYIDVAVQLGMNVGLKILGAIVLWIVGRLVIRAVRGILDRNLRARKIDDTVSKYLSSVAGVLLNILLLLSVLSIFGIETTTFAGLLAAAGVAIGVAWSGLLANLAAGVFMIVLRPFKVGDDVIAGGVEGTVHSIGLFVTTIDTPDNVRTFVGNGKIFGDTIKNFSENSYRRVDLTVQLSGQADVNKAIAVLKEKIATIPNIAKTPTPVVELQTFTLAGPVIVVRPFAHQSHYGAVYSAAIQIINEEIGKLGFPAPANPIVITEHKKAAAA